MTYSVACSSESASSCPRGAVTPADARPAPAVDTNAETAQFGEADTQERLALHVCADTKKRTCRTFHVGDPKASPRPAEWKDKVCLLCDLELASARDCWKHQQPAAPSSFLTWLPPKQAFVHQWQTVRCGIDVSAIVNLPMARTDTPQLEAEVQQALQSEYTRIAAGAVAWADAEHVSLPASQLPDDAVCECTMYMPVGPPEGGSAPKSTTATVNTTLELSGSLSAVAVVPPASTRGAGERALKADIVRSLQARCLSTCRGWDEDRSEDIAAGPVQRQIARLPLRVSAPLIGPILLSDYVDSDTGPEGLGEAVERFQEIFGVWTMETCASVFRALAYSHANPPDLLQELQWTKLLCSKTKSLKRVRPTMTVFGWQGLLLRRPLQQNVWLDQVRQSKRQSRLATATPPCW